MIIIKCDCCGKVMEKWDISGGNCIKCGNDLCSDCSGGFNEDGECLNCVKKRGNIKWIKEKHK